MSIGRVKRFRILDRDGFRCRYCGKSAQETELEVDHVTPRSLDGTDDEWNLVTACFDCNRGKRDGVLRQKPIAFIAWVRATMLWLHEIIGNDALRWVSIADLQMLSRRDPAALREIARDLRVSEYVGQQRWNEFIRRAREVELLPADQR